MSSDSFRSFFVTRQGTLSALSWLAVVALFLFTGTIGHDPWRQDETYSFGIIYHFYTAHTWLVPTNAGTPFMEKPPLYYWTAVLCMRLFSGVLPLHDAARLASVFYMAMASLAVWGTSQVLFRRYERRRELRCITLALFLGSLGLVRLAHDLFTDVALLAGTSVAVLGMATVVSRPEKWARGGAIMGLGVGMAFLSKGLLVPAILGISFAALWVMLPAMRTRKTWYALLPALLLASPFLFIWPWLLYRDSPALFTEWFWANNVGRFLGYTVDRLGAGNKPLYMLYTVLWFAFPAFPLACARVLGNRRTWFTPEIILPLTIAVTGLVLLTASASARALYLLPLLPSFALLAAPALMKLSSHFHVRWNAVLRIVVSLGALVIVAMWACLLLPSGPQPFRFLYGGWLRPGFLPGGVQWAAIVIAVILGMLWHLSRRLDMRSAAGSATHWLIAMTLLWGLMNTLLLPWIDETRSFRGVIGDLSTFISGPAYADKCIARYNLGESTAPMWEYFGKGRGMGPEEDLNGKDCPLLLLMIGKTMTPVSDPRWHMVWRGSRPLDDKDELQLFERNK